MYNVKCQVFNDAKLYTKEEFNEAFEKMISELIEYHEKNK